MCTNLHHACFSRLKYNAKGVVGVAGFSEPCDANIEDLELWFPRHPITEPRLSVDMAKYLLQNVGDRFCLLVEQEKEAMMWVSPDTKIVWKRAVQGACASQGRPRLAFSP